MTTGPVLEFPDGFEWEKPDTWPAEFRELFEYAAILAYSGLVAMDKRMLDCQITSTAEPVTMLFALGDRADELRRAWRAVYAIHNPSPAHEPPPPVALSPTEGTAS